MTSLKVNCGLGIGVEVLKGVGRGKGWDGEGWGGWFGNDDSAKSGCEKWKIWSTFLVNQQQLVEDL